MQVNNWYNTKLYDANGNPLTLDDAGQLQVTWVDVANSNIQYAVNNNNAVSAKNIILAAQSSPSSDKSSGSAGSSIESSLRVGRDLAGVMDEIWLVCEAINNSDVLGFITLRDVI